MKDITHIARSSLPWRSERATECGLDADRHPTWTRDEVAAKLNELGEQRFSLFVCMTCWQTFRRHSTWEHDPASCLVRHAEPMTLRWGGTATPEKRRFADELRAIAVLVERHLAEFDATVESLGDVVNLGERRRSANA